MKLYQKVTQEADGQLFAWYGVVDHSGNVENDFDVLNEYTIYPHEITGAYITEHTPTRYAFWSWSLLEEALEAVKEKVNEKTKAQSKLDEAGAKFDWIVNRNSLDERYKDITKEKKQLTPEQIKEKYARYERNTKLFAYARMKTSARLNASYYDRLLGY